MLNSTLGPLHCLEDNQKNSQIINAIKDAVIFVISPKDADDYCWSNCAELLNHLGVDLKNNTICIYIIHLDMMKMEHFI